jgi:hypothetical protein
MEQVTKEKQLKVVTDNKIGMLAEVTGLVAGKRINIEHVSASVCNEKAVFFLLTSDNEKAKNALKEKRFKIEETDVILLRVWNRPGSLAAVAAKLKEHGVNVDYVYGTSSQSGERMTLIFSSDDNDKAVEILATSLIEDAEQTV